MVEKIGLSFSFKEGRIRIFKETLQILEFAEYYRFLYNKANKNLAIQACNYDALGANKLPEIENNLAYSTPLVNMIYKDCCWDENLSYRVIGTGFGDMKTAFMDLNTAEVVRENND